MKTFENPILKTEFTNMFGEEMTLVLDRDLKLWMYNSDSSNKDFKEITNMLGESPYLGYVLSGDEKNVFYGFLDIAKKTIELKSKLVSQN